MGVGGEGQGECDLRMWIKPEGSGPNPGWAPGHALLASPKVTLPTLSPDIELGSLNRC